MTNLIKLADMKSRPKKAGGAELVFTSTINLPKIWKNRITLPDKPLNRFAKLKEGEHFLFSTGNPLQRRSTIWFGGTDEKAFLVRIKYHLLKVYLDKGPRAFYDALKPDEIKKLEKQLGLYPTIQQGLVWGYPLIGATWKNLSVLSYGDLLSDYFCEPKFKKSVKVSWNTDYAKHFVEGKCIEVISREDSLVFLAQGVLRSKGYKDVTLIDIHLLTYSNWIISKNTLIN